MYCDLLFELQLVVELNGINVFTNRTNNSSAITTIKTDEENCSNTLSFCRTSQVDMESNVGVHFVYGLELNCHNNTTTSVQSLLQLQYHNNTNEIQKQQDPLLVTPTAAINIMLYK